MARCELARDCPFFNDRLAIAHQTAEQFKARYCKGGSADCARYLVFTALGRECVPYDMAPNDLMRARRTIAAAKNQDADPSRMTEHHA